MKTIKLPPIPFSVLLVRMEMDKGALVLLYYPGYASSLCFKERKVFPWHSFALEPNMRYKIGRQ